jgi:hypothetical protein
VPQIREAIDAVLQGRKDKAALEEQLSGLGEYLRQLEKWLDEQIERRLWDTTAAPAPVTPQKTKAPPPAWTLPVTLADEDQQDDPQQLEQPARSNVSPEEPPPSSSPMPTTEAPQEKSTRAPTVPAVLPDDPAAILSLLGLKGPQQLAIATVVIEHEIELPDDLKPGHLRGTIRNRQQNKARARGDKPPKSPQWDACNRFLKALQGWRANQRTLDS